MEKRSDVGEVKIYSNYIIGIVALVLSVFNPLPGLVLGIVGLVRVGKHRDEISKKAKKLNMIAVIVGFVLTVLSIVFTLVGLNLETLAA